ncbi:restriction endonuclease subunit S [Salmonella enterica subsp. enterica serovar Kande]|nr:restriction endonuclease subunit S [Salmonella enterica subsp. enterica serovar Kande]VEA58054.1 restriction endonuclease [Salmonella enterica subsp. enterica]
MNEWNKTTLAEITDIRVSNVDKKSYYGEKSVKLCNYMDVYSNDYITRDISFMEATANITEIAKFTVSKGDVLITKDSETPFDIGIPAVVIEDIDDLICGYHLAQLKPDAKKVNSVFLAKQLAMPQTAAYFSRVAAGSTRYGLSNSAIAKTEVFLPSLAKQERISRILNTIDRAISLSEMSIKKYQEIKCGIIHDLFTKGIRSDGKLREESRIAPHLYKNTPIGLLPKEWDVLQLKELFGPNNIVNGPFGSDLLTSELRSEGVPVIYCQDIRPGVYLKVSKAYVSALKAAQLAFCSVRKGDIILAKVGSPPCDSCVYDSDDNAIVTQDVIRIRPTSGHNSNFFSAWFCSEFGRAAIRKISIEGTRERVSLGDFKSLLLPVPDKDEQERIGKKIACIERNIRVSKNDLEQLKYKRIGLMNDLLTNKVSVNFPNAEAPHV